ncbi:hypothetical protein NIES22_53470 [Calothrix brevissima NIES-22]|nr:hypothetical protein NIES22_53470 [Calothrix brevissima NIES-22]
MGMGHWALKQFWILRKVGAPEAGALLATQERHFSRRILNFRLESKRRSRTRSKRSPLGEALPVG